MKGFKIRICSDLDYEEMVADISYENYMVAVVTQEKGIDNMEIKIFPPGNGLTSWDFPLDDLIKALQSAKNVLLDTENYSLE